MLLRSDICCKVVKWVYMASKGEGTCDSKATRMAVLLRSDTRCKVVKLVYIAVKSEVVEI